MKTPSRSTGLMILLLALAGSGCVLYRPDPQAAEAAAGKVPEAFSPSGDAMIPSEGWWGAFGREDLDRLMQAARDGNFTVEQAEARLRQAEALAVQAGAALWPSLSLSGEAAATRRHVDGPAETGGGTSDSESYSLGLLAASYEVDLWGRVRAGRTAAGRGFEAGREDVAAAWMSVSAQVGELWVQLLAGGEKLNLVREQLETNRRQLELLEVRRRSGQATALDVLQQRQAVAAAESALPPLESALAVTSHQLNVLLGRPHVAPLEIGSVLPELPPRPAAGLPADLLTNRPDVRAAALRLEAAGWNLAAAKSDRLPAIRLTGSALYQSEKAADLLDNWAANLAAGLTGPLLDGGRRRAEVRRNEALRDEQVAAYTETVLQAAADVENALVRERRGQEYLDALERELNEAGAALTEARSRYRNGSLDYLNVLAALTSVQRLELDMLDARADLLLERIGLHRALGGAWTRMTATEEEETP